jgi:endonuclease/exonuclease/phosphatase family metal-dependent hydrolase
MNPLGPKSLIKILLVGVLLQFTASAADHSTTSLQLTVMTFNLRYASDQSPHAWPDRRPVMSRVILESAPDVMGTQEGVYRQMKDLDHDLADYDWIGQGRKGGSKGEYCAVFYRRDRFTPVAYDHFWLSDTPDQVGSMTWGNRWVRMATWVQFKDRESGREFIVINTHFDHQVAEAREKSASLIRERIAQFDPAIPLIVMGDFNCLAGDSIPFTTLTNDTCLEDTWTSAESRTPHPVPNTFHGYKPPVFEAKRIDWILVRQPTKVTSAHIIVSPIEGQMPSDHYPVTAEIIY